MSSRAVEELTAAGKSIDMGAGVIITDTGDISEIHFGDDGDPDVIVTYDGTERAAEARRIDVLEEGQPDIGLDEIADDVLLKAAWNWGLITKDGSRGVHNPFFATDALIAARDALVDLLADGAPEIRSVLEQRTQTAAPAWEPAWKKKPFESRPRRKK